MKSPCRNFFSCWFIAAVLGFLTIFAHPSGATPPGGEIGGGQLLSGTQWYLADRRLNRAANIPGIEEVNLFKKDATSAGAYAWIDNGGLYDRRLEATEDYEDAVASNKFHINLQELSSLLDCQDGCKAVFALITSSQCNSTDAQDAALEFKLEEELTFDKTHIESDEDAPDKGWVTKPFRELINKSTDNTTVDSSPPISLAEFVTAAAMTVELIDAMTPNQDYTLAVYLYNTETEPLACATLELVTEDDELQEYYNLFGGGDGGEGSDVVEGGEGEPVAAVGNASSSLSGGLLAYAVAGVSIVLSAILFA